MTSALMQCFIEHSVNASVIDVDHYRIRGGLAVESDYIIEVSTGGTTEEIFRLSKTFSAFRTLVMQLKKASDKFAQENRSAAANDDEVKKLSKFCDLVNNLVEAQRTHYLGKVNYMYVKVLAKQRKVIVNDVLAAVCDFYPKTSRSSSSYDKSTSKSALLQTCSALIETFFLTDHVAEDPSEKSKRASPSASGAKSLEKSKDSLKGVAKGIASGVEQMNKGLVNSVENMNPLAWGKKKDGGSDKKGPGNLSVDASETTTKKTVSIIVPLSTRSRLSDQQRNLEEQELVNIAGDEAKLLMEEDDSSANRRKTITMVPNYSHPKPTVNFSSSYGKASQFGLFLENNPAVFVAIMAISIAMLKVAVKTQVTVDGDIFLLIIFASFCMGLHTPRPMLGGYDGPTTMKGVVRTREDVSGRQLLKRSMGMKSLSQRNLIASKAARKPAPVKGKASSLIEEAALAQERVLQKEDQAEGTTGMEESDLIEEPDFMEEPSLMEEEEDAVMGSPMALFPAGAAIGSHFNCWSEPDPADFQVRGPKYLSDKKKVPSGEFLFPCRGLDLFLTDACPENVGSNPHVFGGRLREVPTFIINFRLPWGVLVFYFEIPQKFVPFVKAGFEPDFDASTLPSLDNLSPPERATARFLMGEAEDKNRTLKIVPVVVEGPWVVKSVVGGKPALIGQKLPINYVYDGERKDGAIRNELYFEADLDIAASSAARGILSVARSYTQVLTLNLGFVVEGQREDELPEQMMVGARLHGIDPLTAPSYPMDEHQILKGLEEKIALDESG